jgi:hypothetical protein
LLDADPELPALPVEALLPPLPLSLPLEELSPSLYVEASEQPSPPLLSSFCVCSTLPLDELPFVDVVVDDALESFEVEDPELLPEPPLLDALLVPVVLPPVAVAVLVLAALPLPDVDSVELPPLPPVAVLPALPELPALAVDELLPLSLLLELD